MKLLRIKWRKKVRIEVNRNFSTVDIYKGEQLVSVIDLEGSVFEVAKELVDLFVALDIDCEVVEIDQFKINNVSNVFRRFKVFTLNSSQFDYIARRSGILDKEGIYNELTKIAKHLYDEIIKYNFSPSGERWIMVNTPAVNSLTKVFDMICDLGIKLEEDFKNEISE